MDKDGDGYITKTEFQKVCKNLTNEQVPIVQWNRLRIPISSPWFEFRANYPSSFHNLIDANIFYWNVKIAKMENKTKLQRSVQAS